MTLTRKPAGPHGRNRDREELWEVHPLPVAMLAIAALLIGDIALTLLSVIVA